MSDPIRLGIFGWPVAHSKSPQMHEAAARALGLTLDYERFAVEPGDLAAAVHRKHDEGIDGYNLTVPYKQAVMALLDDIDFGVAGLHIEQDVSDQEGILALDHLRPALVAQLRQLGDRYLRAVGSGDENPIDRLDRVAQFAHVPHADRIALTPLDGCGQSLSSDRNLNDVLNVADLDSVPGDRLAVDVDLGLALENGFDQCGDVVGAVLIVGIGVDDDIGLMLERFFQTNGECRCQADMMGALSRALAKR